MASRKARKSGSKSSRPTPASVRRVLRGDGSDSAKPSSLEDLYGGGDTGNLLQGKYHTAKVYGWFQSRHAKGARLVDDDGYYKRNDHEWKIPYGVRDALHSRLLPVQISNRLPFYVTWVSPKTGKRLKKYFGSFPRAIEFIAEKAQYVDPNASVVSRHGYDIPAKLRGKFPRKMGEHMHYWCPRCMSPRRFRRCYYGSKPQTFFAIKKEWSEDKGRYEFRDRELALLECTVCGGTNRDAKFRRSNQPFEVRRFKQGVRRARPRKRRKK